MVVPVWRRWPPLLLLRTEEEAKSLRERPASPVTTEYHLWNYHDFSDRESPQTFIYSASTSTKTAWIFLEQSGRILVLDMPSKWDIVMFWVVKQNWIISHYSLRTREPPWVNCQFVSMATHIHCAIRDRVSLNRAPTHTEEKTHRLVFAGQRLR